jgi:hypothetical protein
MSRRTIDAGMTTHPLDNPVWSSLTTQHASFAVTSDGAAARYPPQVAPFVAVANSDRGSLTALEALVNGGESVYLVGVAPELGPDWIVESTGMIPQLLCTTPAVVRSGPEPVELTDRNRSDMLALTALVFPGFFRARTIEM